jgi:hypothetical protein
VKDANQQGQGDGETRRPNWPSIVPPKRGLAKALFQIKTKSLPVEKVPVPPQEEPQPLAPEQPYQPPKAATWQDNPPTDPWCPDTILEHIDWAKAHLPENNFGKHEPAFNGWKVLGATRRGRMHAHNGTHREDAFAFKTGDCFTVLCVADGAGSSQLSRIGSELACRELVTNIAKSCDDQRTLLRGANEATLANALGETLSQNVHKTLETFHDLATKTKVPLSDFRCTVLLTLLYEGDKASVAVVGQVGDGFIGFAERTGFRRLESSASGDFSGEVKCFMPDDKTSEYFTESLLKCGSMIKDGLIRVSNLEAVLLCTDGIEDPFFPIETNLEKLFSQLKNGFSEPLEDFAYEETILPLPPALNSPKGKDILEKWLSFQKRGENDDRTILVIYREAGLGSDKS